MIVPQIECLAKRSKNMMQSHVLIGFRCFGKGLSRIFVRYSEDVGVGFTQMVDLFVPKTEDLQFYENPDGSPFTPPDEYEIPILRPDKGSMESIQPEKLYLVCGDMLDGPWYNIVLEAHEEKDEG